MKIIVVPCPSVTLYYLRYYYYYHYSVSLCIDNN